jgi:hypothetical protein
LVVDAEVDGGGDVTRGDEVDRVPPGAEDQGLAVAGELGADDRNPGLQIRGGPDDRPGRATGPQCLFGGVLGAVQRHRVVRGCVQHRHQHQVPHTGGDGGLDEGEVGVAVDRLGAGLGHAGADEAMDRRDDGLAPAHCLGYRGRVPQITGEGLHGVRQVRRSGRVAREHAHVDASPGQAADDLPAQRSRPPATRITTAPRRVRVGGGTGDAARVGVHVAAVLLEQSEKVGRRRRSDWQGRGS